MAALPLKQGAPGRVEVIGEWNACPKPRIWNFTVKSTDSACYLLFDPKTKPVPLVARAAILQADVVAKNIIADIQFVEEFNKVQNVYGTNHRPTPMSLRSAANSPLPKSADLSSPAFRPGFLKES